MDTRLTKLFFSSSLILLVNLSGCNYERNKGVGSAESNPSETVVHSTFTSIQTNILNTKCMSCHSSGTYNFSSYSTLMQSGVVTVNSPETSLLYTSTASQRMPRSGSPLNSQQLEAIFTWIKNGAKESELQIAVSPTPVALAPVVEPTFRSLNENIFKPKCLTCHNANKASGDVSFSNYKDLNDSIGLKYSPIVPKDLSKSGVVLTLETDKMPPGNEKLTQEQKNAVKQWILKGAAND